MEKCIGRHQTGFMKKRLIYDNIKEAQTLWDLAELENKPLIIIALLDQERAYDRVDDKPLWRSLEAVGVPDPIITAIKGCYSSAKSRVMVNRFLSDPFKIRRGVRQGDSLSCLLYKIVIEGLALCQMPTHPRVERHEPPHGALLFWPHFGSFFFFRR